MGQVESAWAIGIGRALMALALALGGEAFGFGSTQGSVVSQVHSSKGDGIASYGAFEFVGEHSPFRENYSISRVSNKLRVEIDSRREPPPPKEADVRVYFGKYGLEGKELERAVQLTRAADAKIRGWMKALRELNLPDKRLADLAGAADRTRFEQFKLETLLHDRRGFGGLQAEAIDGFATFLKTTTSE